MKRAVEHKQSFVYTQWIVVVGEIMDIRELECFIEVCKHMNFTKAGKVLHFSQQGISKVIGRLEAELGVPLFYRTKTKLELTEYGLYFYPRAQKLFSEYQLIQREMHTFIEQNDEKLRLAMPKGMTWDLIGATLINFYNNHPDINFELSQMDEYECEEALLKRRVDMGFCVAPVLSEEFEIHASYKLKTYYMVSEKNPLSEKEKLALIELKDQKFLGFGINNKGHDRLVDYCHNAGYEPEQFAEVSDMRMLQQMVKNNLGVGFYVGSDKKNVHLDGIKIIEDENEDWPWEILLVTLKDHCLKPLEKSFIDEFDKWKTEGSLH